MVTQSKFKNQSPFLFSGPLFIAALFIAPPFAWAGSFTIVDGQLVTVQQTLGEDDSGVIESGGSLIVAGDPAIFISGDYADLTNNGVIETLGTFANGIYSTGDNV